MMKPEEIRNIRIDIVDGKFTIYWFVTMLGWPDDSDWWRQLREFLLSQPRQSRGLAPETDARMEEAELSGEARKKFVELLEKGPTDYKSVRRARKVFPVTDYPIVVTFFAANQPSNDEG